MAVPSTKPTLICTIWTEKLYNLESFRAQMKIIWKTRKKFEIQMIGSCLPEFDKKDLLHAIGVTFGGVIRFEIIGDSCRLRINLDVQKSLRRGSSQSLLTCAKTTEDGNNMKWRYQDNLQLIGSKEVPNKMGGGNTIKKDEKVNASNKVEYDDGAKRLKHEEIADRGDDRTGMEIENIERCVTPSFIGSAAAKR
ncbi:hypothetical protein J1N35_034890 [Gossypium stocksii]|uniref:DUF4283 domain-containing protein n=1 Tax=Gossypium stocksii TaxID=47602 RepID=A0A9D3UTE5_9ROSI|nr:hypothetical protein J1N35_034890 [Gossypium stocksii]